jgi:hypothetical protein
VGVLYLLYPQCLSPNLNAELFAGPHNLPIDVCESRGCQQRKTLRPRKGKTCGCLRCWPRIALGTIPSVPRRANSPATTTSRIPSSGDAPAQTRSYLKLAVHCVWTPLGIFRCKLNFHQSQPRRVLSGVTTGLTSRRTGTRVAPSGTLVKFAYGA